MAHDKAYLICENKCLVPGYSQEEIDELLKKGSLAVVDKNTGEEYGFWIGTKAEYDALEEIDPKTIYIKKDEEIEKAQKISGVQIYKWVSGEKPSRVSINETGVYLVTVETGNEGYNNTATLVLRVKDLSHPAHSAPYFSTADHFEAETNYQFFVISDMYSVYYSTNHTISGGRDYISSSSTGGVNHIGIKILEIIKIMDL